MRPVAQFSVIRAGQGASIVRNSHTFGGTWLRPKARFDIAVSARKTHAVLWGNRGMPQLVRLYIRHVLIGWGIAGLFCAMLIWFNVAGLRHLILETDMGWLAGLMLFVSNGVVFAGVQFAIAVMLMAEDEDGPRGGRRERAAPQWVPLAIPVEEKPAAMRRR